MDRAHRLGQKRTVNVYRILTRNTLEEKIMSLQQFKLDVAGTVVNQENMSMQSMDKGRLLDLFLKPGGVQRHDAGDSAIAGASPQLLFDVQLAAEAAHSTLLAGSLCDGP